MIYIILLSPLYFLPTIIAGKNKQGSVFVLNLFLGWTIIGWLIALIWAAYDGDESDRKDKKIAEPVITIEQTKPAEPENPQLSKYDELEKLADLKNKGVISEEEFIAEKRKILGTDEPAPKPAQEIVQETTKESAQNTEENNKEKLEEVLIVENNNDKGDGAKMLPLEKKRKLIKSFCQCGYLL